MSDEAKLGILCKLYYRSSGTYEAPTFTEISLVGDLQQKANWDKGDASTRRSRVKKSRKTMVGLEWTGKIRVSNDDAGYLALWNAAHSDDALDVLILNGPKDDNGSRGYRVDVQVFQADEDQGMANVLYMDFNLEPTDSDNEPQKAVVAAGAPVYSDVAPTTDGA